VYKVKGNDINHEVSSMMKYEDTKQEIDKLLEQLIMPYIFNQKLKILDACCGIGHISRLLGTMSNSSKIIGFDIEGELIEVGRSLSQSFSNIELHSEDIFQAISHSENKYDISVCWKTLSWLDYYEDLLTALVHSTKKHIFISSLFYDGDIDFSIMVREFKKDAGKEGFNKNYNVYSLPQFKRFSYSLGVKNIDVTDFDIKIDIPSPLIDEMGTYTVCDSDGKRIQISGAVVQHWKIIRIDL
jgi:ubiquinone/menaquinone biosynthesis C-methylase UbiE